MRLRWSKNVNKERNAPKQIVFASMDPAAHCLLLSLGNFFEVWVESVEGWLGPYVFGGVGSTPDSVKESCYNALEKDVLDSTEFCWMRSEPLGMHSAKK